MPHLISISEIFGLCQKGTHSPRKLLKLATDIFNTSELDAFYDEFSECLKRCLIVKEKNEIVDNLLTFAANFATSLTSNPKPKPDEDGGSDGSTNEYVPDTPAVQFNERLWDLIIHASTAANNNVRLHVCELVTKLLSSMNENVVIDEDLFKTLRKAMLKRLNDKIPSVRAQAVLSVGRLHDTNDPDCPVLKQFIYHLNSDCSFEVRARILDMITVSKVTLPCILKRTADIKDSVRRAAYEVLSEKVHIRSLTIAQRIEILKRGFNDHSAAVQKCCKEALLERWIGLCEDDILKLLHYLDVEDAADVAKQVVDVYLKKIDLNGLIAEFQLLGENRTIKTELLTCESAFYWRSLAEYLKAEGNTADEYLGQILLDLPPFCDFIERYMNEEKSEAIAQLEQIFIARQLMSMIMLYDFVDESERKCVQDFVERQLVLSSTANVVIPDLIKLLTSVIPNERSRTEYLLEIMSQIREKVSSVAVELTPKKRKQIDLQYVNTICSMVATYCDDGDTFLNGGDILRQYRVDLSVLYLDISV